MSSKLKTSVAALALLAVFGTGLATAQTTPAAPETAATTAPAGVTLPEILQGEGFSNVTSRDARGGGLMVQGTITATGRNFDAMVDSDGALIGIRTTPGAALPQEVVAALVPEAARANPVLSQITTITAIGTRDGAVMISGQDSTGKEVRAGFAADGELMHFGRGDRGGRDGKGGKFMGDRGDRGSFHGRAPRDGDHARPGGRGDHAQHAPRGDRGPRASGRGQAQPGQVDPAAIHAALAAAGYTEAGDPRPGPGGLAIDALNPQGEAVTLTVTARGEVLRETAR